MHLYILHTICSIGAVAFVGFTLFQYFKKKPDTSDSTKHQN